jgi:hypothetical protein
MSKDNSGTLRKITRLTEAISKLQTVQNNLFNLDGLDHADKNLK